MSTLLINCFLLKFSEENVYTWSDPGIGRNSTYMIVTGVVFFGILLIIEYSLLPKAADHIAELLKRMRKSKEDPPLSENSYIDNDVKEEKRKVNALIPIDLKFNDLVLRNLTKIYGKCKVVNEISVALKR